MTALFGRPQQTFTHDNTVKSKRSTNIKTTVPKKDSTNRSVAVVQNHSTSCVQQNQSKFSVFEFERGSVSCSRDLACKSRQVELWIHRLHSSCTPAAWSLTDALYGVHRGILRISQSSLSSGKLMLSLLHFYFNSVTAYCYPISEIPFLSVHTLLTWTLEFISASVLLKRNRSKLRPQN